MDKQTLLREYTRAIRDGSAALFVGAGVSRAAGYVDWKQLLAEIAADLGLDVARENDLVALAQFHVNARGGRDGLNRMILDEFVDKAESTPSHELIASLPIETVWTTNYDPLIEDAYRLLGKRTTMRRQAADFSATPKRSDVTVYKMHGDKDSPADAILTKEDYESYDTTREVFTLTLKSELAQKTFLFAGFSFDDPNVLYILARVKPLLKGNSRKHYCLLRKPVLADFDDQKEGAYKIARFEHWLKDLERYNIKPVLIDAYDEVQEILQELNRRSHLRDVFISGSAHDFNPLGEAKFRELCEALGTQLIKDGFNIISGFGLGVGGDVIIGAMRVLKRNDDQRLKLWPFPQSSSNPAELPGLWHGVRTRMVENSGVCVVLAGNKVLADGSVVPAGGVHKEIEIAQQMGRHVIPIGATGHVALEHWNRCQQDQGPYVGSISVGSQLATIGDGSADVVSIVAAVIQILKLLDK